MNLPDKKNSSEGHEPVWIVVATTAGITEASIIAERLKSLGIPSMVHQEPLGGVLGLSIGMGQARVVVPEAYYEVTMRILEPDESIPWLEDGEEEDGDQDDEQDPE
jgi:hypothetical protein